MVLSPRASRGLSLRLLSQLSWRDLAEVAATARVPAAVRLRADSLLRESLRDLRLGDRVTLARLATASVLVATGPERASPPGVTPLSGTPSEIAAGLRAYADVGIGHLQVRLQPNIPASWERFGAVLEELDRAANSR